MSYLRLKTISVTFVVLAALVASALGQTPTVAPRRAGGPDYRIGPGDELELQVWGRADLTGTVTVDPVGRIQVPLLGYVRVQDRTVAQVSVDLTERYQLLDPTISDVLVSVAEYMSLSVSILGEVNSPGTYGFPEMPDVWEALLTAGGATDEAELSRVQIVRQTYDETEPRTLWVDLSRGIEGTPASTLPTLRPGDRILIPSAESPTTGGIGFQVLGAVNAPGSYRLSLAATVVEGLAVSGGPKPEGDLSKVQLNRLTLLGAVSYELDVDGYLKGADPLVNFELRPGDTLVVPQAANVLTQIGTVVFRLIPLATTYILATR